ncbi:sporulation protein YabP [Alkalihalobacillus trypoxylicola]|uniref:Sporulation protein YabP n=1 Tax=Alkalihalobacillus trypoxylicola TaxID=519424 RepID=A0A161Q8A5_9BACI|nr:sporulation protein YabP [Alkalihalobacillus trypoxylicola]KYG33309.1 sporulation protein YabP [Alkalihalobacillus trypoxylicola]GAF66508.1 sporulation protein YabP [Bacillus sp. TS-2]
MDVDQYQFGTPMGQERQNNDHDIILKGRKHLDITGVKQVESFDNEEFLLETVMGFLSVRGQNLHMKNLNVEQGIVSIEGKIFDFVYLDQNSQEKSKGFFGKLFK